MKPKPQYRWATVEPDGMVFDVYRTKEEAEANLGIDSYMCGPAQHKEQPTLTVRKVRLVFA